MAVSLFLCGQQFATAGACMYLMGAEKGQSSFRRLRIHSTKGRCVANIGNFILIPKVRA